MSELELAEWAATRYPRNYYVWKYRLSVMHMLDVKDLVLEFERIKLFVFKNISDRSAQAYLEALILHLLTFDNFKDLTVRFIKESIQHAESNIIMFPEIKGSLHHLKSLNIIYNNFI